MNDDQIKDILNNDQPKLTKPVNEWTQIVNRIEKDKANKIFNWKVFTSLVLSSFLLIALNFYRLDHNQKVVDKNDELIVEDLSEISDYLSYDSDSIYAWVE